jgi:hypothetical protein
MAPRRTVDRDNGMRRISTTTRWLAGLGAAVVAALSLLFASRAASSGTTTPSVNTPVATAPATTPSDSGSGSSAQPVQTAPPVTSPPVVHSHSGGS